MKTCLTIFMAAVLSSCLLLCICKSDDKVPKNKYNLSPKYKNKELLRLEEIGKIDIYKTDEYLISRVTDIDTDKDNNLYVLDKNECKIAVFDSLGQYLKSFGGKGGGPKELFMPEDISVFENRLYIYEAYKGLKVWSLNGDYVEYIRIKSLKNLANFKFFKDFNVLSQQRPVGDHMLGVRRWEMFKIPKDFGEYKVLITKEVNLSEDLHFFMDYIIPFNSDYDFYFPVERNEYRINKYDESGNFIMSFSRKYNRKPFSEHTRKSLNNRYAMLLSEKFIKEIPSYPPVVRYIFTDDHDFIWVIVGEWYIDDSEGERKINTTIDIFDKSGEFLFTFETDKIGLTPFIKKNRLYSMPAPEQEKYLTFYKVVYNFN